MNPRIATLLTLALAAMAFAQTPTPPGIRRLPPRSAPATHTAAAQTNEPVQRVSPSRQLPVPRRASQSYVSPTAKSDDLVESPATNVVKGAFGYTLGAIWDGKIPEEAEPDKNGEVSVPVEAKEPFEPFSSVTLSISTNDSRIACIAAETPRMVLAESYAETCEKIGEIAAKVADGFGVKAFVTCHTNQVFTRGTINGSNLTSHQSDNVLLGKLYRDYLKNHPEDPDFIFYKDITISPFFWYTIHPIAGSRYNESPIWRETLRETARPDYLQQIWQPCNLSADCYPYTGEAVIRFSVRDVEDRTEHTNLVSVAQLKAEREKTKGENTNAPGSYLANLRRRQANRAAQATQNAEEIAKLRAEIAQAAKTSKEEAAKRERAINLELISRGQEPLSPVELSSNEEAKLARKGALAAPEVIGSVATQTNAVSRVKTPSSESSESGNTGFTNGVLTICGIRLGGTNDDLVRKYNANGYQNQYEVGKEGKTETYSCLSCSYTKRGNVGFETLFDTKFNKYFNVSITSHRAYFVKLETDQVQLEAAEKDILSFRPLQLANQIAEVLKSKYGEPKTDHSGDNKSGKRKWHFEKDGLYITLEGNYWSGNPTTEQAQKGLRTYYATTTLQYIHLPTLEAAIEEGREFSARPLETDGESAKRAAERL